MSQTPDFSPTNKDWKKKNYLLWKIKEALIGLILQSQEQLLKKKLEYLFLKMMLMVLLNQE